MLSALRGVVGSPRKKRDRLAEFRVCSATGKVPEDKETAQKVLLRNLAACVRATEERHEVVATPHAHRADCSCDECGSLNPMRHDVFHYGRLHVTTFHASVFFALCFITIFTSLYYVSTAWNADIKMQRDLERAAFSPPVVDWPDELKEEWDDVFLDELDTIDWQPETVPQVPFMDQAARRRIEEGRAANACEWREPGHPIERRFLRTIEILHEVYNRDPRCDLTEGYTERWLDRLSAMNKEDVMMYKQFINWAENIMMTASPTRSRVFARRPHCDPFDHFVTWVENMKFLASYRIGFSREPVSEDDLFNGMRINKGGGIWMEATEYTDMTDEQMKEDLLPFPRTAWPWLCRQREERRRGCSTTLVRKAKHLSVNVNMHRVTYRTTNESREVGMLDLKHLKNVVREEGAVAVAVMWPKSAFFFRRGVYAPSDEECKHALGMQFVTVTAAWEGTHGMIWETNLLRQYSNRPRVWGYNMNKINFFLHYNTSKSNCGLGMLLNVTNDEMDRWDDWEY